MPPALLAGIDLWNPAHAAGFSIIVLAFLLGLVHGITPDEHTWPITFSYAIGGYSTKRGLTVGLVFSLAFTAQRALASELAELGLSHLFTSPIVDPVIYMVVGILMSGAGLLISGKAQVLHLHLPFLRSHNLGADQPPPVPGWAGARAGTAVPAAVATSPQASVAMSPPEAVASDATPRPQAAPSPSLASYPGRPVAAPKGPTLWMAAVHGFVAGWGFGAFSAIIYTVLAPAEHSAAWGWVPGAFFGLGTMAVQVVAGGLFGLFAARRGLSPSAVQRVALRTAANTLTWGGGAFVIAGAATLAFPQLDAVGLSSGLHVHNLHHLGIPFLLVIFSVLGVGVTTLVRETRRAGLAGQCNERPMARTTS